MSSLRWREGTFHKLGTTPPQLSLLQSDANFTLDRGIFEDIGRQRIWNYGAGVVMVTGNMCTVSTGPLRPRSGGSRHLSLSAALQHARV